MAEIPRCLGGALVTGVRLNSYVKKVVYRFIIDPSKEYVLEIKKIYLWDLSAHYFMKRFCTSRSKQIKIGYMRVTKYLKKLNKLGTMVL